jgi:hypothetical protein
MNQDDMMLSEYSVVLQRLERNGTYVESPSL